MEKSAEAIVAEPNPVLMTDLVDVGSESGEGSCEGLNDKPLDYNPTYLQSLLGDRFP